MGHQYTEKLKTKGDNLEKQAKWMATNQDTMEGILLLGGCALDR